MQRSALIPASLHAGCATAHRLITYHDGVKPVGDGTGHVVQQGALGLAAGDREVLRFNMQQGIPIDSLARCGYEF